MYHVPCLGHIINLAVQTLLGPNGLQAEAPTNDDMYIDDEEDEDAIIPSNLNALIKLRRGVVKIR